MLGDSTMRFQYLNLAYTLTHGHQPQGSAEKLEYTDNWRCSSREECSHLAGTTNAEEDYRDPSGEMCKTSEETCRNKMDFVKAFFNGTMSLVRDKCDCWRAQFPQIIENRYYVSPDGVHLTSLHLLGRRNVEGNWVPGDSHSTPHPLLEYAPRWSFGVAETLHKIVEKVKPTVVVINMGLHLAAKHPVLEEREWAILAKWASATGVRLVWKTTHVKAGGDAPMEPAPEGWARPPMSWNRSETEAALAQKHGLQVFPAHKITAKLDLTTGWMQSGDTFANPHLTSHGNGVVNEAMLGQLYGSACAK